MDALSLPLEDQDPYAFPPVAILGKVMEKLQKNYSDCSRVAQYALVLGPSDHVKSDPNVPVVPAQSADPAIQSGIQESAKSI